MNGVSEPTDEDVDRILQVSERQLRAIEKQNYAIIHTHDGEFIKLEKEEIEFDDLTEDEIRRVVESEEVKA